MASELPVNPLTEEHLARLDRVLKATTDALPLAEACADCGWDVADLKAKLLQQQEMARVAKARFFPDAS